MFSDERQMIQRLIEQYVNTGSTEDANVKVMVLAENKTSAMEKIEDDNRTVMLDEYHVGEVKVWSGYSSRSKTVFLSVVKHN